jgi:hypothetical protein
VTPEQAEQVFQDSMEEYAKATGERHGYTMVLQGVMAVLHPLAIDTSISELSSNYHHAGGFVRFSDEAAAGTLTLRSLVERLDLLWPEPGHPKDTYERSLPYHLEDAGRGYPAWIGSEIAQHLKEHKIRRGTKRYAEFLWEVTPRVRSAVFEDAQKASDQRRQGIEQWVKAYEAETVAHQQRAIPTLLRAAQIQQALISAAGVESHGWSKRRIQLDESVKQWQASLERSQEMVRYARKLAAESTPEQFIEAWVQKAGELQPILRAAYPAGPDLVPNAARRSALRPTHPHLQGRELHAQEEYDRAYSDARRAGASEADARAYAKESGNDYYHHGQGSEVLVDLDDYESNLPGGRAEALGFTVEDADPDQLRRGLDHELEHTDDRALAQEIALDHLAEDARYYDHLDLMEAGLCEGEPPTRRSRYSPNLAPPPPGMYQVRALAPPDRGKPAVYYETVGNVATREEVDQIANDYNDCNQGRAWWPKGSYLEVLGPGGERERWAGHTPNRAGAGPYWVWSLRKGTSTPLLSEGPYGPHDLDGAKTYARIAATQGGHDRAVSLGRDPKVASFKVVRVYAAGTGARLV